MLRYEDDTGFSGMAMLDTVTHIAVANLQGGGLLGHAPHEGPMLVVDLVVELRELPDMVECVSVRMSGNTIPYAELLPAASGNIPTDFGQFLVLLRRGAPQAAFVPASGFVPTVPDAATFSANYLQQILLDRQSG